MALSAVEYIYNGTDNEFLLNFPLGYTSRDEIHAFVNDLVDGLGNPVEANITFLDDNRIRVDDPLVAGDTVLIRRIAEKNELEVEFDAGADVTPRNLDAAARQGLSIYQEILDGYVPVDPRAMRLNDAETEWEGRSLPIKDVGNPINSTDATNKAWVLDAIRFAPENAADGVLSIDEFVGDGNTAEYTLSATPSSKRGVTPYVDGLIASRDSFSLSGRTVTFTENVPNGVPVQIFVASAAQAVVGGTEGSVYAAINTFTGDGSTVDFTMSITPEDANGVFAMVGGVVQARAAFSVFGDTLTFSEAPAVGEPVELYVTAPTDITIVASDRVEYNTVADLLASSTMYSAGTYIHAIEGDFTYKAAASGDVTNAGGQQFEVLPADGGYYDVKAFGAVGDGVADDTTAIRKAVATGKTVLFPDGAYLVSDWIELSTPGQAIICNWKSSPIRQTAHGRPVFYVIADDVFISRPWLYSTETRSLIAGDMQTVFAGTDAAAEGTLAAFEFGAGIFVSKTRTDGGDGFTVDNWYVEGFPTSGIFVRGTSGSRAERINLGVGYAKDVDFGIKSGSIENIYVEHITGENISSVGSGEPEHVFYIITGQSGAPAGSCMIGSATAKGVANGNHAFQVKYCPNMKIGQLQSFDATGALFNAIECEGVIEGYHARLDDSGTVAVFSIQTNSKVRVGPGIVEGPFAQQAAAGTNNSKAWFDSPHVHHTGLAAHTNRVFFASSGATVYLEKPVVEYETAVTLSSATSAFYTTAADMVVVDPRVSGLPAAPGDLFFVTSSGTLEVAVDPHKIDQSFVNTTVNINTASGPYDAVKYLRESPAVITQGTNGATPIVSHGTLFETSNSPGTTVTDFLRAPEGHKWSVKAGNANTTYQHSGSLVLSGGVDANPAAGDVLSFQKLDGVIYEVWRSF